MNAAGNQAGRVTPLELFFDLVFVFTITQLTAVLYHAPTLRSLVQVMLMLAAIWWMYGGYAWMTNAVSAHTANRRLLLLGGMGGYFVLALAIPRAFTSSGLAFGIAYLVVVSVHTALFTRSSAAGVVRAILRLAPYNLGSALVILAGGALGGAAQYALWSLAVAFEWLTPVIRGNRGFDIAAAHFVERHGLVVIIAIGESRTFRSCSGSSPWPPPSATASRTPPRRSPGRGQHCSAAASRSTSPATRCSGSSSGSAGSR
jgi:low temperature requirement protein LtrA